MSAFRPISPHAAIQIFSDADIGVDRQRLLADLAMAGVVKSYARLIETTALDAPRAEVRDSKIARGIWRQIITEEKIADIYQDGSVHLAGNQDAGRTSVIGIRFDEGSVRGAAADHGAIVPAQRKPIGDDAGKKVSAKKAAQRPVDSDPVACVEQAPVAPKRALIEEGAIAISVQETASVLGVSVGTVYKEIGLGRLVSTKTGRRRLVSVDSIRSMLS